MPEGMDGASAASPGAAEALPGCGSVDSALLLNALTHSSDDGSPDYQRLEFLGDAVIELCTRDILYREFPLEDEGSLTRRKNAVVSTRALAARGRAIGLDRLIRTGSGLGGGVLPDSVIAGALEALAGAVFLGGGLEAAGRFTREVVTGPGGGVVPDPGRDSRSMLQEMCQRSGIPIPAYRVVRTGGMDHAPTFRATVRLRGRIVGRGAGTAKKEAQSAAAKDALGRLGEGG